MDTKITKLSVFDFDGTLVNSPMPDTGRIEYEKNTGQKWPHVGWWGKPESLDQNIFDISENPSVINAYRKEKANPNTRVIMLTGRMSKMGHLVKDILDSKGLSFDGYYYNTGGSTDVAKIRTLEDELSSFPSIEIVELWDDRESHVPMFEAWGDTQTSSGRLKRFDINLVITNNPSH